MKPLDHLIDRSRTAQGWDASVRAAAAPVGGRSELFAAARPIGQGVTMNVQIPGEGGG